MKNSEFRRTPGLIELDLKGSEISEGIINCQVTRESQRELKNLGLISCEFIMAGKVALGEA